MVCTANAPSCLPIWVDPVKVMPRVIGEPTSFAEICAALPNTTLSTPAGKPASSSAAAIARAVAGVSSDGLMITEQPAASALLILRAGVMAGAFHGAKAAIGPSGSRSAIC